MAGMGLSNVLGASGGIEIPGSTRLAGTFRGPVWTPWTSLPSNGQASSSLVLSPWTGCRLTSNGNCVAPPNCTGSGWTRDREGASLEAAEYRVHDTALTSGGAWTPLRFPGQYYDPETELYENWNRYYDPKLGRYWQPDPVLSAPRTWNVGLSRFQSAWQTLDAGETIQLAAPRRGVPSSYSYAQNNPVSFNDPTGFLPWKPISCFDDNGGGYWGGGTGPGKNTCGDCEWLTKQAMDYCLLSGLENCACKQLLEYKAWACFSCNVIPHGPPTMPPSRVCGDAPTEDPRAETIPVMF
jgi:RHS repeat-associated protein